jgi:hypothetical protein
MTFFEQYEHWLEVSPERKSKENFGLFSGEEFANTKLQMRKSK